MGLRFLVLAKVMGSETKSKLNVSQEYLGTGHFIPVFSIFTSMKEKTDAGWGRFLEGYPWFTGENKYLIRAYSEFMPPVKNGISPFDGSIYPWVFSSDDMFGWHVLEIEEELQLRPGLEKVGRQVMEHLVQLGSGTLPVSLAGHNQRNLQNNLFWPEELASHEGRLHHERYVAMPPFSLSKTKDDKGRVCWTFFGASEQGPEKAFWRSFYESPGKEAPESVFTLFMQWIFKEAYGIHVKDPGHLSELGFRILPSGNNFPFSYWKTERLPSWTKKYLAEDQGDYTGTRYLLSFRPYGSLPADVREMYLTGKLHLLPFPGSMILWGIPEYVRLQETLYNAIQIPMLRLVKRDEGFSGLRVPQSGWLHQPTIEGEKAKILEEFIVNNYIRTSRWDRFHRNEDALLKSNKVDPVVKTLFSTTLEALDLYNKPMARNSQIFTESIELLLDGPRADRGRIGSAALEIMKGGLFRYRFYFPPMQAGRHEVFWHRPLAGCISHETGKPVLNTDLLTGFLTGYLAESPDPSAAVELWPRLDRRGLHRSVLASFNPVHDHYLHQTSLNLMALLDTWELLGKKRLERSFARGLIRIPKAGTLEEWLASFPDRAVEPSEGKKIAEAVEAILETPAGKEQDPACMTFEATANREYEEAFWKQIHFLAHGEYINKDNADVVQDTATLGIVPHPKRDLHDLGDYLIGKHGEAIRSSGMDGMAEAGELPFKWETDFEFNKYGGWQANQSGTDYERNILVVIPGKNRKEAVVMADHYDTAYMADVFDPALGGSGARISAAGADDNHSATATLLLAAPVFLNMSKKGLLERDVWLLHLTGEEFPSDCMGARNFCQHVVQKTLAMRRSDGTLKDLSGVEIKGILVMDMIAHNRDNARDIFQIAPGKTAASLHLAQQAHLACNAWNAGVPGWNEGPERKGCQRGQRITDIRLMPKKALHLKVEGEIRTWEDPHSTLYNTDGMIFSDTGIPVILFMENYDIQRKGYHDTYDTMENIDLDYGAAVSAIAVETIARIAKE
jgi:hypothetical protein